MRKTERNRRILTAVLVALLLAACGSDAPVATEPDTESTDPMHFGRATLGVDQTESVGRAAGTALQAGFLVSTYKAYGNATRQQTVMDRYEARYKADNWSNSAKWETVGTVADGFYQEQHTRYWDYAHFPYRFHALSPCPKDEGNTLLEGFVLTDKQLTLPATVSFQSQTVADGSITPAEGIDPYKVAQAERRLADQGSTATDHDLLSATPEASLYPTSGNQPNRAVPLPFHHLTAKVRFGIYTTVPGDELTRHAIHHVTFYARSATGFCTEAAGYSATLGGSTEHFLQGSFDNPTRLAANENRCLLSFVDATQDTDNAVLEKHLSKANAYFLRAEQGMVQIPQQDVELSGTVCIGSMVYTIDRLTVTGADGNPQSVFHWQPGRLYTYYIVVTNLQPLQINFTASLADWEDVDAELSTDLEQ